MAENKNPWLNEKYILKIMNELIKKRGSEIHFIYDETYKCFFNEYRTIGLYPSGTEIPEEWEHTNGEGCRKELIIKGLKFLEGVITCVSNNPKTPLIFEDEVFQIRIAPVTSEG